MTEKLHFIRALCVIAVKYDLPLRFGLTTIFLLSHECGRGAKVGISRMHFAPADPSSSPHMTVKPIDRLGQPLFTQPNSR